MVKKYLLFLSLFISLSILTQCTGLNSPSISDNSNQPVISQNELGGTPQQPTEDLVQTGGFVIFVNVYPEGEKELINCDLESFSEEKPTVYVKAFYRPEILDPNHTTNTVKTENKLVTLGSGTHSPILAKEDNFAEADENNLDGFYHSVTDNCGMTHITLPLCPKSFVAVVEYKNETVLRTGPVPCRNEFTGEDFDYTYPYEEAPVELLDPNRFSHTSFNSYGLLELELP